MALSQDVKDIKTAQGKILATLTDGGKLYDTVNAAADAAEAASQSCDTSVGVLNQILEVLNQILVVEQNLAKDVAAIKKQIVEDETPVKLQVKPGDPIQRTQRRIV